MLTTDWQTLFLSGRGTRQVGTILRGREILHEDSLAFTDDERIRLAEMTAANDQLGARTIDGRMVVPALRGAHGPLINNKYAEELRIGSLRCLGSTSLP
jgi:hypothetical protein